MAGRGRGSLMDELMKETSKVSETSLSELQTEKVPNQGLSDDIPRSPLGVFSLKSHSNAMSSGGRGLMTPSHFMKGSTQQSKETSSSIIKETKTSALLSAEEYLKTYAPKDFAHRDGPALWLTAEEKQKAKLKESPGRNISIKTGNQKPVTPQLTEKEKDEADAEWQKYKFQRQINAILANVTDEEIDEVFNSLKVKLDGCSLSQKYPQYNELGLIIECLVDKATKSEDFIDISKCFIKMIAEYDAIPFDEQFTQLISKKASDLVTVSASDKKITAIAQRFCKLLGAVYKSSINAHNESFNYVVTCCLQDCIEQWTYPRGVGQRQVEGFNINKAEAHAHAAVELFKEMELHTMDSERVGIIVNDMERMFDLLKESVLNEFLPRKIREVYLNLLIAYAPRWLPSFNEESETAGSINSFNIEDDSLKYDMVDEKPGLHAGVSRAKNESQSSSFSGISDGPLKPSIEMHSCKPDESITIPFDDDDERDLAGNENSGFGQDIDDVDEAVIVESDEVKEEHREILEKDDIDNDVEIEDWKYSDGKESTGDNTDGPKVEKGPYHDIKTMLKNLQLEDQFYRFEENVIRDTVLTADKETLKNILKDASFPPGIVYEIVMYLDKKKDFERGKSNEQNQAGFKYGKGHERAFNSPRFQFSDSNYDNMRGNKPTRTENAPRKKILGIGRGGSSYDPKSRSGFRINERERKINRRQGGHLEDDQGRGSDAQNWRMRQEGERTRSRTPDGNELYRKNSGGRDNDRRQDLRYDSQETRQIGKVEPLPRRLLEEKESQQAASQSGTYMFGSGVTACYRCGGKGHRSDECTDHKSLFFG